MRYTAAFLRAEPVDAAGAGDPLAIKSDPFSVIAQPPPCLSDVEARDLVQRHWGLTATLRSLISERDQNFRVASDDGRRFVLKIANSAEDPEVTDFQIQGLRHIEAFRTTHSSIISTPIVVPDIEGRTHIVVEHDGARHVVRMVSYVEGIPLEDSVPGDRLFFKLGEYLAHLGVALLGFEHAAADQSLLWDMKTALRLRELLPYIEDLALRSSVSTCLDDFEQGALPVSNSLRAQVIHNDFNPDNVLVDSNDNNLPAGVIDFGDMLKSPLIFDVAVAASYLRVLDGNSLAQIAEFVAGYHSVTPLQPAEIDILPDLIIVRLCTTITVLKWREALRGADDPYLQNAVGLESSAELFLARLLELPRQDMRNTFRQVCASVFAGS